MPQTLVGVIYDAMTLAITRLIIPHDDSNLPGGSHAAHVLGPGEAMTTITRCTYATDSDAARAAVRLATGREPPS